MLDQPWGRLLGSGGWTVEGCGRQRPGKSRHNHDAALLPSSPNLRGHRRLPSPIVAVAAAADCRNLGAVGDSTVGAADCPAPHTRLDTTSPALEPCHDVWRTRALKHHHHASPCLPMHPLPGPSGFITLLLTRNMANRPAPCSPTVTRRRTIVHLPPCPGLQVLQPAGPKQPIGRGNPNPNTPSLSPIAPQFTQAWADCSFASKHHHALCPVVYRPFYAVSFGVPLPTPVNSLLHIVNPSVLGGSSQPELLSDPS